MLPLLPKTEYQKGFLYILIYVAKIMLREQADALHFILRLSGAGGWKYFFAFDF